MKALCFLEAPDRECVMYAIQRERSQPYRRSLREWSFELAATRTLRGRSLSRWTFASTTIALGIQYTHPRCELHPKQARRSQLHVSSLCRNRCVSPIHADGCSSVQPYTSTQYAQSIGHCDRGLQAASGPRRKLRLSTYALQPRIISLARHLHTQEFPSTDTSDGMLLL